MYSQALYLLSEKLFRLGVVLIVGVFCARAYSQEVFGYYSLVLAINGVIYAVISLGLDNILIKRRVRSSFWKETFIFSFCIRIFLSIVILLSFYLLITFYSSSKVLEALLILSISNLFYASEVFLAKYRADEDNFLPTVISFFVFVFGGLGKILLVKNGFDIVYVFWASVLESIFFSLIVLSLNVDAFKKTTLSFNSKIRYVKKVYKPLALSSLPLLFTSMVSVLYMRVDQFFLSYYSGLSELAVYSVGSRLIEVGYVLIGVVASALFPKILKVRGQEQFNSFIKNYRVAWALGISLLLLYIAIVAPFAVWLYGEKYTQSYWVIILLAFGMPIVALRNFSGKIFITLSYYKHVLYRSLIGLAVNIFLNFCLVPYFGAEGAAIATLLSLAVVVFVYDLFINELKFNNKLKFKVFSKK